LGESSIVIAFRIYRAEIRGHSYAHLDLAACSADTLAETLLLLVLSFHRSFFIRKIWIAWSIPNEVRKEGLITGMEQLKHWQTWGQETGLVWVRIWFKRIQWRDYALIMFFRLLGKRAEESQGNFNRAK